ncbi:hypothetical protein ACWE42_12200 [Sutcliffiella cohnii]|uniref:hypothetical protein n=1 Tax=Sutcliffiella TaxID=2837511 RepID=UPI0022DE8ACD|nr:MULTISPECIES: hypothetical protein [Sutcliffiella]MED4018004.1 hypothetical protein [Sutcliffiella cohnii]WBL16499.1 hypothetical protein O1A01_07675 [Sutcliffiella sp. NC1]
MNKKVLNIIGVMVIGGMLLLPFFNPYTVNQLHGMYKIEKIALGQTETIHFLLFVTVTALLYFFIVNFREKLGRTLVLGTLVFVGSGAMIVSIAFMF